MQFVSSLISFISFHFTLHIYYVINIVKSINYKSFILIMHNYVI